MSAAREFKPVDEANAIPTPVLTCARMTAMTLPAARMLLARFLGSDVHYLATASNYGDGGATALERALNLFVARPEIGFVWLAAVTAEGASVDPVVAGACVVCYAISTSRGSLVAKLDDVTIDVAWQGRGVGSAMLWALGAALRAEGVTRIDTACHRDNRDAWRFYERVGFRPLDEERIALLL